MIPLWKSWTVPSRQNSALGKYKSHGYYGCWWDSPSDGQFSDLLTSSVQYFPCSRNCTHCTLLLLLNFSLSAQEQHILVFRNTQIAAQCTVEWHESHYQNWPFITDVIFKLGSHNSRQWEGGQNSDKEKSWKPVRFRHGWPCVSKLLAPNLCIVGCPLRYLFGKGEWSVAERTTVMEYCNKRS